MRHRLGLPDEDAAAIDAEALARWKGEGVPPIEEIIDGAGVDICELDLDQVPVAVLSTAIDAAVRGESLNGFFEPSTDTIYLRADLSPPLRRFVLAHELGHAVLTSHRELSGRRLTRRAVAVLEAQADRFAATLMLQGRAFERSLPTPLTLACLAEASDRWQAPLLTAARRVTHDAEAPTALLELDLEDRRVLRLRSHESAAAWASHGPLGARIPRNHHGWGVLEHYIGEAGSAPVEGHLLLSSSRRADVRTPVEVVRVRDELAIALLTGLVDPGGRRRRRLTLSVGH